MAAELPEVPPETISGWHQMVELMARLAQIPAALVVRTTIQKHGGSASGKAAGNSRAVRREQPSDVSTYGHGAPNSGGDSPIKDARRDPKSVFNSNVDLLKGPCVGYPLKWPGGALFGTIRVLARPQNERALIFRESLHALHALHALADVIESQLGSLVESSERKRLEARFRQSLARSERELEEQTLKLKEASTAFRALVENVEKSWLHHGELISRHVNLLVLPHISKLRRMAGRNEAEEEYLQLAENDLRSLTSSFSTKVVNTFAGLTATEGEIAQLVMHGKKTKEIARMLSRATGTVGFHRNNIRKKLNLGRGDNLRAYLLSLR